MAAAAGPRAMFVAGGTDLYPKLKRRQFEVDTLIGLDFLPRGVRNGSDVYVIGAGTTLADASRDPHLTERQKQVLVEIYESFRREAQPSPTTAEVIAVTRPPAPDSEPGEER